MMKTEPIKIHIDRDAVQKPAYTAATVPIHWPEEVSQQLKQDVAMGVIEPVTPGVPTTWQARMTVVAKSYGSPRRAIDFQHCKPVKHYMLYHHTSKHDSSQLVGSIP